MKFSADFSELAKALDFCNIILNDKTVEEKMRNVIFMVRPEGVTAVGYNALTFAKQTLEKASVDEVDPAGYDFQVKSSDLNKIISSFNSLYKTKVETVDFELDGVRIKVTVHEVAIKEEDERLNQSPEFFLECPPILANIKKEISMEFPEDFDGVGSRMTMLTGQEAKSVLRKIMFLLFHLLLQVSLLTSFQKHSRRLRWGTQVLTS